jgi:hypothetical protein
MSDIEGFRAQLEEAARRLSLNRLPGCAANCPLLSKARWLYSAGKRLLTLLDEKQRLFLELRRLVDSLSPGPAPDCPAVEALSPFRDAVGGRAPSSLTADHEHVR